MPGIKLLKTIAIPFDNLLLSILAAVIVIIVVHHAKITPWSASPGGMVGGPGGILPPIMPPNPANIPSPHGARGSLLREGALGRLLQDCIGCIQVRNLSIAKP